MRKVKRPSTKAEANASIASITAERWAALVKRPVVSRQTNDNYQFAYSAQVGSTLAANHVIVDDAYTNRASRAGTESSGSHRP